MTVSDDLVGVFERAGIDHVFGFPCEQMEPYYASIAASDVRHVLARSEASAALMADAYARTGDAVGVCDGVGGPGAAYISVGLVEAAGACSPVLALTGDNDSAFRGREVIQDADNEAILDPHVSASYDPEGPDRVVEAAANALREAAGGVPGPTHVNLTEDLLGADGDADTAVAAAGATLDPASLPVPDEESVAAIADLLADAERPVLLCGEGAVRAEAFEEVHDLAHTAGAPVVTSMNGKGIVAETDPCAAGVAGRWGYCQVANDLLEAADAIVGLGCRFGDLTTVGWSLVPDDAALVHVDLDPHWLGHNYAVDLPVQADARATADRVHAALEDRAVDPGDRIDEVADEYADWRDSFAGVLESDASPIKPQRVVTELHAATPPETILCSATSFPGFFTGAFYQVREAGPRYLQARGSDGINVCLPHAIGAQVANPDTPVVAVSGDGGIGYHIADLETAAREDLPLTVVVFNNQSLGSSKASMLTNVGVDQSTDFHPEVDYAAVARGFGCEGQVVTEVDELGDALAEAVASDAPTLLDVHVDPNAFPPVLVD
jgi:acetolactate synthase-1/2/3 large subunit